jgi:hypothetical protein
MRGKQVQASSIVGNAELQILPGREKLLIELNFYLNCSRAIFEIFGKTVNVRAVHSPRKTTAS